MRAIRWSDHDRYLGPFTFARGDGIAAVLGSGDGDDYPGCRLRLTAFGCTVIVALPAIIQPWRRKVKVTTWDAATVARLGRDWYWDQHKREYGFRYSEGFLIVYLGRQTHDSSTEQSWSKFLPWTQWRFVRHSLYDLTGKLFADLPQGRFMETYDARKALENACPSRGFAFLDYDGESITARTLIEEREWWFGTGWFKWLSLFRRPKVRRSLDIRFSAETGKRKGSWKGGTMGTGIDMLPGELHGPAFRRYCAANNMTFKGEAIMQTSTPLIQLRLADAEKMLNTLHGLDQSDDIKDAIITLEEGIHLHTAKPGDDVMVRSHPVMNTDAFKPGGSDGVDSDERQADD